MPSSAPSAEVWTVNLSETDSRTMNAVEIVAAHARGEMGEAFVWKDGMSDWKPLLDVPELAALVKGKAAPSAPPPPIDFGVKPHVAPGSTSYADAAAEAAKPMARVASPRAATHDLFGGVEQAGSEEEARQAHAADAQKLTGQRNENSVLFSLDALKAGLPGGPIASAAGASTINKPAAPKPATGLAPKAPAPPAPGARPRDRHIDDVMNIGGGGLMFSLGADQALLTAPAPPEPPKPKPAPVVVAPAADGAVAPAALLSAPPVRQKSPVLILLLGLFGGLAIAGAVVVFILLKRPPEVIGKTEPSAPVPAVSGPVAAATKPQAAPALPPPTGSAGPAETPSAEATGASPATPAVPARPLTEEEKKRYAEQKKKADEEKAKAAAAKKEEDAKKPGGAATATPPPAGGGGFDKGAAVAALNTAASAASACKRADGPTGSGRVTVTFAPSGRATNAVVSGGSFSGTSVGGCVASVFRRARVPAFTGDAVTVSKSFTIAP